MDVQRIRTIEDVQSTRFRLRELSLEDAKALRCDTGWTMILTDVRGVEWETPTFKDAVGVKDFATALLDKFSDEDLEKLRIHRMPDEKRKDNDGEDQSVGREK